MPQDLGSLLSVLTNEQTTRKMTHYRIAQNAGVTIDAVRRFFVGYHGEDTRIRDQDGPGRVRFDTALRIVRALGFDLRLERLPEGTQKGEKRVRRPVAESTPL